MIRALAMICLAMLAAGCRKPRDTGVPRAVPVAADGGIDLRVMTFNVRYENSGDVGFRAWQHRLPGIVRMIHEEKPDLIGIQEALHGQAADLWASLPDYELTGVGRDDGKQAGEYAAIFHRRDQFEAKQGDQGTFWLSATPRIPGSKTWGNTLPRIAVWTRLTDRASGRSFLVFNTHWDHQNQASREHAALLIASHIDALASPDLPVILMGDFNSNETNPAVAYLTGQRVHLAGQSVSWTHPLIDTFRTLHAGQRDRTTLHFWQNSIRGSRKVDHIFTRGNARILASGIRHLDKPMLSDHFPVTAHIVFP